MDFSIYFVGGDSLNFPIGVNLGEALIFLVGPNEVVPGSLALVVLNGHLTGILKEDTSFKKL